MIDEKLFTTEQVANILQVHPFTVLKFIREGKLPGIKLGRVYRIKESDIKNFLEERMTRKSFKKPKVKEKKEIKENPQTDSEDLKEVQTFNVTPDNTEKGDDHYYII